MFKEGIMLEKIMNLHILLYCMAALGAMGAIGMLATHLTCCIKQTAQET